MPKIAWHAQQLITLSILKASCRFDCCPPGWLYSPVRMGNSSPKKSHKFQSLPPCSILYFDLVEFSENQDKEFQLRPMLFQTC